MGMPETTDRWTRERVLALPDDGNRYELFDGELLVTPAPAGPHQFAVVLLQRAIDPYVLSQRLGWTFTCAADLHLGGDQLSQPDLFVVPEIPADRSWAHFPNPILVVEILSPGSARFDRLVKRRRFQRAGIPEYWIVDLDARTIERWRPGDERGEVLDEHLTWRPAGATEDLVLDLPTWFSEVWGHSVTR
jgi:Uma2 family endonuclease